MTSILTTSLFIGIFLPLISTVYALFSTCIEAIEVVYCTYIHAFSPVLLPFITALNFVWFVFLSFSDPLYRLLGIFWDELNFKEQLPLFLFPPNLTPISSTLSILHVRFFYHKKRAHKCLRHAFLSSIVLVTMLRLVFIKLDIAPQMVRNYFLGDVKKYIGGYLKLGMMRGILGRSEDWLMNNAFFFDIWWLLMLFCILSMSMILWRTFRFLVAFKV